MWLIPLFAGIAGYVAFKSKGGSKGIGKKAGEAAVDVIKEEAKKEATKVYRIAINAGKHPLQAAKAAALAVKMRIEKAF